MTDVDGFVSRPGFFRLVRERLLRGDPQRAAVRWIAAAEPYPSVPHVTVVEGYGGTAADAVRDWAARARACDLPRGLSRALPVLEVAPGGSIIPHCPALRVWGRGGPVTLDAGMPIGCPELNGHRSAPPAAGIVVGGAWAAADVPTLLLLGQRAHPVTVPPGPHCALAGGAPWVGGDRAILQLYYDAGRDAWCELLRV